MADSKFIDGIRVYKPKDNAPSFVISNGVINRDELLNWLNQQEAQIRFDIKLSQKGGYYVAVNDFKPQAKAPEAAQVKDTTTDLPF